MIEDERLFAAADPTHSPEHTPFGQPLVKSDASYSRYVGSGGMNRIDVGHFGPETCLTVENGSRYRVRPRGSKHGIVLTLSRTLRAGFARGAQGPPP